MKGIHNELLQRDRENIQQGQENMAELTKILLEENCVSNDIRPKQKE